jgi:hypothetical protein
MQLSPSANLADVTEKQRFETISTCARVNLGLVRTGEEIRMPFTEAHLLPLFWVLCAHSRSCSGSPTGYRPVHFAIADEVNGRISC